jgi:dihydrolipoamide dehydrogenase
MFTDPALATIGATPSDAMVVGGNSYADRNAGVVRVYADRDRGVIKGACLFGPGMDHVAHLFAWAIERSETANALLQLPFYHPMFEEGLKTGSRHEIHILQLREPDGFADFAQSGA